ncbi:MAG: discoidin domain-containing protein [bacterium]|nr:discoidin domain-containing protein [bacterium]
MTINGNAKIFYMSYLLGSQLSTATASTGDVTATYDNNPESFWISVGSDDLTTEDIEYTFAEAMNIDRILLKYENWKEFTCQYWTGSAWADFTNVVDEKDGTPVTGISYTDNALANIFFEFDQVSTTKIKFSITKTFVVDEQKTIADIFISLEIGTFIDDILSTPNKFSLEWQTGEKIQKLSNEGSKLLLKGNKALMKIAIKQLWEVDDQQIVATMFSLRECAISLCGCDCGDYVHEGWRLQDVYNCIVSKNFSANHNVGRDKSIGYDYKFQLLEV